jgi:hypothetical protein
VSDALAAPRADAGVRDAGSTIPVHHRRQTCRACGGRHLELFLALGPQPLANVLPASPAEFAGERYFPLDVYFCTDCALVQLVDVVDPAVLFGHYLYVTGTSETIAEHNVAYAATARSLLSLGPRDLVVEVASNDGSLLSCFRDLGVRVLGVEPARNIAALARDRGIDTVNRFFDGSLARDLRAGHGPARAVVANNVLAHVDDPIDFLAGCRELIADDGLVMIEVPYAREMLERLEYDTVYHEHLCYFAVAPLSRMAAAVGLRIARIDEVSVHGGSIRVYFGRGAGDAPGITARIHAEAEAGVTRLDAWKRFGRAAEENRVALRELLTGLAARGATLGAYGAPAKGNTLLNYCGIGPDLLPFTVDRNPLKVGRWTPGTHIPVLPVEALIERRPDYALILAWNFADEVMRQQAEFAQRGGRFILPVPSPRVAG